MKKLFSWLLLLQAFSLLTVGFYQVYLSEAPSQLSFVNYSVGNTLSKPSGLTPSRITIASLGIDLPVYQATIVNNVWPTTTNGASYLTSSPIPGAKGNSILYAHDWASLFGPLRLAKVGEKVVVTFPDKTKKTFVIAYTSVIPDTQATILAPSTDTRITLYTCTGFLDSERFVAVAKLQG